MTHEKVYYHTPHLNYRDEIWYDKEESKGTFLAYANDYTKAVVKTEFGTIIKVPINKIRFE